MASAYVVTPTRDYPSDDPRQPERWGFSKFYSPDPTDSRALMPKYNAHFVPVKYSGRVHCVTGKPLPLDTDYQAAVEGVDASEFDVFSFVLAVLLGPVSLHFQLHTSLWPCRRSRLCPSQSCGSSARAT